MSLFSCKDTVRLVSRALDQRLTLGQRTAVSVHLSFCPMCSGFRRQLNFLRDVASQYEARNPEAHANPTTALSAEARERLRQLLQSDNP
jgi:hypothetical protein